MRPPAIEKMGYYPTHEEVAEVISTYISPASERGRLLDPCCGEGKAASMLGLKLNCETWGAELSYRRAAIAEATMTRVYQAPWESTWLTPESVSFLFLNPPYDTDSIDNQGRLEAGFLKSTTPALIRGGLLVYIIPQKMFANAEIAKRLVTYYKDFKIGLYKDSAYGQAILFAIKRDTTHIPEAEEVETVVAWGKAELDVLESAVSPAYQLLPSPVRGLNNLPIVFKRKDWTDEETVNATLNKGVMQTSTWKDLLNPKRSETGAVSPVMPLKKGHVAMLMASGMVGIIRINDEAGMPMLIKGRVIKEHDVTVETTENGEQLQKTKDRFVTTISVVAQKELKVISDVAELTTFMQEHGDKIGQYILDNYRPLYNFDPTDEESAILDTLGKKRRALPGQKEPGLLPTQRHAAAAVARSIRRCRVGNIQGEMGTGKTTISAGTMALLNSFPALVMCPPHLVPKWIREIEGTIPGSKAVELRRIGQNANDPTDVNDVRTFFEQYDSGLLGSKAVAVVASTAAKMGAGWKPAVVLRKAKEPNSKSKTRHLACCCPVCGSPALDNKGFSITDPEEMAKRRYFCEAKVPGWELDADGRILKDKDGYPVWGKRTCGTALFSFATTRRVSIAEYILKHYKGRFKLLVCDEVHQAKGKSSDRGIAFHQLITGCKATLTLTGTFFGGKSTSIFWLLHRLNPGVRRDFAFADEMRWAKLYGVLTVTRKGKGGNELDEEDGVFTGNRRYRNQAKEEPGISPAIINRLLDTTVFLSLKDLGVNMPEYREEVAVMDMEDAHLEQYEGLNDVLKRMARQNYRYLSTWLQWTLARPNSAFRDELVAVDEYDAAGEKTDRKLMLFDLPAVVSKDQRLPKEEWLANYCLAERKQSRKVLVYVRQTGTRDIQGHLETILEKAGLRVTVLHGNIDPRKREEWIAKRTPATDVLVCNPKLVETGLDLIAYSTVVFLEIEYSLYTLWQAVRRVWRLGQQRPVKAIFAVYHGTMEARALELMGKKMKAAQLLYGDEVGGAIVPDEDGDFLTQLARDVLEGVSMQDLTTLFAEDAKISHGTLGSMTLPSEVMTIPVETWEAWKAERGLTQSTRRKGKRSTVEPGQASLFW